MQIHFYKFHGNGNDFIIVDNREDLVNLECKQIQNLCNRRFGIGADGLMLLNTSEKYDFEMVYYNSDGKLSSMCGNGGRCIAAFAKFLGIIDNKTIFEAIDGEHKAIINNYNPGEKVWNISLQLSNVLEVEKNEEYYFLNTGSPHYVEFVDNVAEINVVLEGKKTRYNERFAPDGTNVNFVEKNEERIFVRTYERGVEDETLSCGTGVAASAIAFFYESGKSNINVHTTGGDFEVIFKHNHKDNQDRFTDIWLIGPATLVFEGEVFF
ncbi:MAG: diaminopimelate epimerase [Bacteroidetes bacterium]|nr:diaminopimelate epimerase [Bacteroidota bacterium]